MKVEVKDLSSVKKLLQIEIPNEQVVQELDSAYKTLKKTAKIKGFRPGKAPRAVLENFYRKDVHADVSNKLLQESFPDAVKEAELSIVGNPQIDPPELDEKAPFAYEVTVEIKPEISDIDFKGMTLEKSMYPVMDKEIDGQLTMIQKNLATMEPIEEERSVQEEDFALSVPLRSVPKRPALCRPTESGTVFYEGRHRPDRCIFRRAACRAEPGGEPGDYRQIPGRSPEQRAWGPGGGVPGGPA